MKELDQIVDAIQWHEGMLLTPQHFQQMSLRQEQLLHYTIKYLSPFYWGVLHLKFDSIRLADGQFAVFELEAMMPDGLMVAHDAEIEELSIELPKKQIEETKQKNILIHLAVPNYLLNSTKSERRYRSIEGESVRDMNEGEGGVSIPRLKPRLRLFLDQVPPRNRFTSLPLAQVAYLNEAWEVTSFVPPVLQVNSRSILGEMLTSVIQQARGKAKFLSEQLRASAAIQSSNAMMFNTQNILQGLGTALPQLEAMLATEVNHPYPLYLGLCALAGSIATFTSAMVPPVFEAYQHNDLRASFAPVCEFIGEILDRIRESYIAFPFDRQNQQATLKFSPPLQWLVPKHYFVLKLESQRLLQDQDKIYCVIGLKSQEGVPKPEELISWGESCLIGSSTQINFIRERRTYGAQRKQIIGRENKLNLLPPQGIVLFRVEVDNKFIEPDEVLIIVNELEKIPHPTEIILYAEPQK